jgi:hypothetical protein
VCDVAVIDVVDVCLSVLDEVLALIVCLLMCAVLLEKQKTIAVAAAVAA